MKDLVIALVLAAGLILTISKIQDARTLRRGLPPGYHLEVNGQGRYRPCDKYGPLIWLQDHGTEAQALRHAWRIHESRLEYEKETDWKIVPLKPASP